jgi:23S rRNA pseudouridine1911/1915/1917 synthase
MLARTSKALERMNRMFMERQITKIYWAVVTEQPDAEEGELVHWIAKETDKNIVKCYNSPKPDAKEARLFYKVIGRVGKDFLLEINLYTGRSHQIRAQLGKMGWPIKGDLKYGSSVAYPDGSIMLHSRKMIFEHPVKKEMCHLEAVIPNSDDWRKFKQLAN